MFAELFLSVILALIISGLYARVAEAAGFDFFRVDPGVVKTVCFTVWSYLLIVARSIKRGFAALKTLLRIIFGFLVKAGCSAGEKWKLWLFVLLLCWIVIFREQLTFLLLFIQLTILAIFLKLVFPLFKWAGKKIRVSISK